MSKVYQIVTDRIVQALEAGTVPWRKSWAGGIARNLKSDKPYRGINAWLTNLAEYCSPYWLTFKQAQALGGNVRKGEQSTPIVFWKLWDKIDKKTGDKSSLPVMRYYSAFNSEQCDGLDVPKIEPPNPGFSPIQRCEEIAGQYLKHGPQLEHTGDRPSYSPTLDRVKMPKPQWFTSTEDYYGILFHELTHSTGHKSRLDRKGISESIGFGSETYAKEEMIAEMGSAFLSAECRLESALADNEAAYIASWLKAIRGDVKLVVQASSAAQKAADLILGRQWEGGDK